MSTEEMKEYIVTLHSHEELDNFYQDMETPGGNLYIPERAVDLVNRRPNSRNTHYMLNDSEAEQLRQDPRVWAVEVKLDIEATPAWSDTNGYYSKDVVTTTNDRNWGLLRGFDRDHVSGWGSDGATKTRTSTLTSPLNGVNVDYVIRGSTIASEAPEFASEATGLGGTRYFYVNWGDYGLGTTYTQAPLTYTRTGGHETTCASIVLGNTQGWARKARFTSIPNDNTYYDYVRNWHQSKPINPQTGYKNPTIVSDSFGINYGIDVSSITNIVYRGATINGPFTSSTDFSQYKLWLNNTGETLYQQPNNRVIFSYYITSEIADIEDLVSAGVIFVGVSHNWRAYTDVVNGPDWNNTITFGGGTFYYNRGFYSSANNAICTGAIMDLASNTISPRSGRGPRINIWAPSRTTAYSHYAGETPDGTGLGFEGGVQTSPTSQCYLPMIKNSRDPRNSNYYIVKTTDGTSFSTPQVAGVIGLLAELKPNITAIEAMSTLTSMGDSTGVVSTSTSYSDLTSVAGATTLALGVLTPTFAITANRSAVLPTDTVSYTITTTNVPNGSTVYLTESGTALAGDFVDGLNRLAVIINSNSGSLLRVLNSTFTGSRSSSLQLRTGGYDGTIQVTSSAIAMSLPAATPAPTPAPTPTPPPTTYPASLVAAVAVIVLDTSTGYNTWPPVSVTPTPTPTPSATPAPTAYNPIIGPAPVQVGQHSMNVLDQIAITVTGGPPGASWAVTKTGPAGSLTNGTGYGTSTGALNPSGSYTDNLTTFLIPGVYTFVFTFANFTGTITGGATRTYVLTVLPGYTLALTGENILTSGQPVTVTITGAPNEVVTYSGTTSGTLTLNNSGKITGDLAYGVILPPKTYKWTLDGNKTPNIVSYELVVSPQVQTPAPVSYTLAVTGPSTVTAGSLITLTISGAPNEVVTFTGTTTGSGTLGANGRLTVEVTQGNGATPGYYAWNLDGNVTTNVVSYAVTVTPAVTPTPTGSPPVITSFYEDNYYFFWTTTGSVTRFEIDIVEGPIWQEAALHEQYPILFYAVNTNNNSGQTPYDLHNAKLFLDGEYYIKLTVFGPGGIIATNSYGSLSPGASDLKVVYVKRSDQGDQSGGPI